MGQLRIDFFVKTTAALVIMKYFKLLGGCEMIKLHMCMCVY